MAENILYADLNLPKPTTPRLQKVPDDQDCTYAEVKVKSQDTDAAANCKSSGKSWCSRKLVAILVVIILVLVLAACLIITYGPAAGSQNSSTTSQEDPTTLSSIPEEALGCPAPWKKHGRKCYFFSREKNGRSWKASRKECTDMGSDLVIIDSREELNYLLSQAQSAYYLLGLTHSQKEKKWRWINDMEHDPAMFSINGRYKDYGCVVVGYGEVQTAPCNGDTTTQNMCEKDATMSKRYQKKS